MPDPFKEQLVTWLKANSHRNKRERRGIKALLRLCAPWATAVVQRLCTGLPGAGGGDAYQTGRQPGVLAGGLIHANTGDAV